MPTTCLWCSTPACSPSLFAPFLWIQGVRHLGPNRASIFLNVMPVVTVAIAATFLGEKPHLFHLVGGAMALAGVMLAQMRAGGPRRRAAQGGGAGSVPVQIVLRRERSGRAAAVARRQGSGLQSTVSQSHIRYEPMAQYVYTMNRVGKIVPPKRQILRDISLSFFLAPRSACWA